ncbi:uncharacterized protein LOC142584895 isoform X4 [Dermacentor variabilis]|uniref:uncharacterized protein LOC142584895 isoform X4 n=1 Tax=Dermacentor variabilis TaxID=34621 RepID=UPI003F5B2DAE
MPSQMVDVVWVKPKRTVVVSEATRGSRRLALHRLRASLIGENGRLPQANSDAAQSLQWGTEDSRSQGGEEPAKKGTFVAEPGARTARLKRAAVACRETNGSARPLQDGCQQSSRSLVPPRAPFAGPGDIRDHHLYAGRHCSASWTGRALEALLGKSRGER